MGKRVRPAVPAEMEPGIRTSEPIPAGGAGPMNGGKPKTSRTVFKKRLRAAPTCTLLVGCYLGYVHAFERLVQYLRKWHPGDEIVFHIRSSRSREAADALAKETLGPDHWSVTSDQPFAYYNA